jgi:hypothetical protein
MTDRDPIPALAPYPEVDPVLFSLLTVCTSDGGTRAIKEEASHADTPGDR